MSGRHPALLLRSMGESPLGILVSSHDHPLECGHCFNCNGLEFMRYTGGFDPVAGFPTVGLSLAVLWSWLVLNVCCEEPGRVFSWIVPAMTVSSSRRLLKYLQAF